MKKLLTLAAIATAVPLIAVESANIVGYATQDVSAKKYNAIGACFAGVGADGTFKLNNIIPTGWDYENDELRIINPANSATTQGFVWLTAEEATEGGVGTKAGWYDGSEFTYEGDQELDLGSGLLTSLFSKGVSFTYSGEVYAESFALDCSNKKYNIVPNALPRAIKVNEIVPTGWDYENDELRILNPANSATSQGLVWLTAEEATEGGVGNKAGWYDGSEFTFEGNQEFEPGYGFLTSLFSKGVIFSYPSAVAAE